MHCDPFRQTAYQVQLWVRNDFLPGLRGVRDSVGTSWRSPSLDGLSRMAGSWWRASIKAVAGLAGTSLAIMLLLGGRYRTLNADECRDARSVFGGSLDLECIFVSTDSLLHRLIFRIQALCFGCHRAFVTNNLIHVAPGGQLQRHVLIHELTHVWQAAVEGPSYLCAAVHAQLWGGGYNYGYEDGRSSCIQVEIDHSGGKGVMYRGAATGEGAQGALRSRGFESFNPEQQGQILMHYFVRRVLLGQSQDEYSAWIPHVERVARCRGTVEPAERSRD
jgi:hypothetical protein